LLRDAAAAIKHARLFRDKKFRVVRRAEQTQMQQSMWNDASWDDDEVWADDIAIVETEAGDRVRVSALARELLKVAEEEIKPTGRVPASLRDICSVLG
jgi:hypothetical protein